MTLKATDNQYGRLS